jgi:large subunit ribosomal protein L21
MYAVIETGGKQYRVSPGQTLEVELLPGEPGSELALERVLLVSDGTDTLVGTPIVPGGRVIGTVVREGRGEKILVFKFRAKKRYRRLNGHRQDYTYVTVTDIQANGKSLVADEERKRCERIARRAVARFQSQLLGDVGSDGEAVEIEAEAPAETVTDVQEQAPAARRTAKRRTTAEPPAPTTLQASESESATEDAESDETEEPEE